MGRKWLLFLVVAVIVGWLPIVSLWLNPPALIGDEAYYARVPVEMRERGDWLVPYFNGEPRYKKPPLMYWLVVISQSIFGENEQAVRLPSLVAVFLTGVLLVWFGLKVGSPETGIWAATFFLLNPMTAVLGNWGATEATLCFFVTASILSGFVWLKERLSRWLLLSGAAAGLGILTKGAPGLVLPSVALFPIAVLRFWSQSDGKVKAPKVKTFFVCAILWLAICFALAAPWFAIVGGREGEAFWQVFLWREHIQRVGKPMEGHSGPIWFYLPVIWLLFLPWSTRLPYAFANTLKAQNLLPSIERSMAWWAISVVVLFSLVATKLPHYVFPAFPALAWLCALQAQRDLSRGEFALGLLSASLPTLAIAYASIAGPNAYTKFLSELGFTPQSELRGLTFAFRLLLLGFAFVPLAWLAPNFGRPSFMKVRYSLLVSGAILTAVTLSATSILMGVLGGREAVNFWLRSKNIATFGSDTEWVVFYAGKPVPLLGRNIERLRTFLTKYNDAAILARVDFAPVLREEGLKFVRFGVWGVASKWEQR